MRFDFSQMRMAVALKPDNTYTFEKQYSWAIEVFCESEGGWLNVHFGREDSRELAWQAATIKANEVEAEFTGRVEPPRAKLKLKPSVT